MPLVTKSPNREEDHGTGTQRPVVGLAEVLTGKFRCEKRDLFTLNVDEACCATTKPPDTGATLESEFHVWNSQARASMDPDK